MSCSGAVNVLVELCYSRAMAGEQFVDVTYRGLDLGKGLRISELQPSSAVVEHPEPMPAGTELALIADDKTMSIVVVHVREKTSTSKAPAAMIVAPLALDEAGQAFWGGEPASESATAAEPEVESAAELEVESAAEPEVESAAEPEAEPAAELKAEPTAAEEDPSEASAENTIVEPIAAPDVVEATAAEGKGSLAEEIADETIEQTVDVAAVQAAELAAEQVAEAEAEKPVEAAADEEPAEPDAATQSTKTTTVMSADEIQAILQAESSDAEATDAKGGSAPKAAEPNESSVPAGKSKKKKRRRRRKTRT